MEDKNEIIVENTISENTVYNSKKTAKTPIPLIRYLVYLLIVTLTVTGVSLSKYATSSTANDNAKVAKFDVQVVPLPLVNDNHWYDHRAGATKYNANMYSCIFKLVNNSDVAVRTRVEITSYNSISAAAYLNDPDWYVLAPGEETQNFIVQILGLPLGNPIVSGQPEGHLVKFKVICEQID